MMRTAVATLLMMLTSLTVTHRSFAQAPAANDARAGLMLMRAINTAENAEHRNGTYLPLDRLATHPALAKVAGNLTFASGEASYLGQRVRLLVAADGQRYQASIVTPDACGVALFTDEGGSIYTGRVLDCP